MSEMETKLDKLGIRHHKIGVFDIDGVLRGKYVSHEKFLSACDKGLGFCDVVLGWDCHDRLYDNTAVSGWHTGYRDAPVVLDPTTFRTLPFEPNTALVLGSFVGDYADACPRTLLGKICDMARSMGFEPAASAEYEFFVFDETPYSAREKGYRGLKPFTPGMFGYSVLRSSVHHELYHELMDTMSAMDVEIEGLHTETGPGVLEAAIRYDDDARRAGDKAALFKTFTKVLVQRRGLMATFMAKWSDEYPGQSGHIHVSLKDSEGNNVFHDPSAPDGMSQVMRHFIAGQVALMPELLAMVCSTVNAYRRLVPGTWAPTSANWGIENRTTAIRAIPAGAAGTRSEYRIGPADANPYLAMSAAIASGLWGIKHKMDPGAAVEGSAYDLEPTAANRLPGTLGEAARKFAASSIARELFGDTFVDHFAATRDWEDRAARRAVPDWDLARYFEII